MEPTEYLRWIRPCRTVTTGSFSGHLPVANMIDSDNVQCILMIVGQIPEGRVATYGQIARLAGIPRNSRQVGSVLKTAPSGADLPWYRVVNSRGEISHREDTSSVLSQREVLESEGVRFDERGRIPLREFLWEA